MIVLSNGEKLSPVAMEAALRDHPGVSGTLIVGQGKFSTAAIIELTPEMASSIKTSEDRASFLESLWPYAMIANQNAPAHAQLAIDRLMIASADKPFLRAGKGTVQRGVTVKLFESEIEELYQRTEKSAIPDLPQLNFNDLGLLQKQLRDAMESVSGIRLVAIDQDFFSAGMDSLHVMQLAKHLKSALNSSTLSQDNISTRVIYTNPTLATLAGVLKSLSQSADATTNGEQSPSIRERRMQDMLQKYVDDLPVSTGPTTHSSHSHRRHTVILTGSTGSLGSYLLDTLARCPEVERVYCLNRKAKAEQLQTQSNTSRGLISEWGTRVAFLHADLSKPQLGLSTETYDNLEKEVSVIIRKPNPPSLCR